VTAEQVSARWEPVEGQVDGQSAMFVLPTLTERDDPRVREGIARRRITGLTGECPCGARRVWPNRADRRAAVKAGRVLHIEIVHEEDCPATDDALRRLLGGRS